MNDTLNGAGSQVSADCQTIASSNESTDATETVLVLKAHSRQFCVNRYNEPISLTHHNHQPDDLTSRPIPIIGVIGGIGSGKTALTTAVGQILKVCRLDADSVGHDVLKLSSIKDRLRNVFGSGVFQSDGDVSRPELAKLVFGETEVQKHARKQLEDIVHPEIRRTLEKQLKEFQEAQTCDVIMLDAALMLEAGWSKVCDAIVFLDVPDEVRLQRVAQRGWSGDEFRRREASQLSLAAKRAQADVIIDNSRSIEAAARTFVDWIEAHFPMKSLDSTSQTRSPSDSKVNI